jgi:hypothetical protein
MTSLSIPRPTVTNLLRRAARAWRIRRNHRHRALRLVEVYCPACRRWLKPRRFSRNTLICRPCADRHRSR